MVEVVKSKPNRVLVGSFDQAPPPAQGRTRPHAIVGGGFVMQRRLFRFLSDLDSVILTAFGAYFLNYYHYYVRCLVAILCIKQDGRFGTPIPF